MPLLHDMIAEDGGSGRTTRSCFNDHDATGATSHPWLDRPVESVWTGPAIHVLHYLRGGDSLPSFGSQEVALCASRQGRGGFIYPPGSPRPEPQVAA